MAGIAIDLYYFLIIYPLFFFVLPQSLFVGIVQLYEKWNNRKYIIQFLKATSLITLLTTLTVHLYYKARPIIDLFPYKSVSYYTVMAIEMILYIGIPLVPLLIAKPVLKYLKIKHQGKLFYLTSCYFIFSIFTAIFFFKNFTLNPSKPFQLPDILYLPNFVNIPEIFDILQSSLLHDLFHLFFSN